MRRARGPGPRGRTGVTLLEVLAAIFVTGVGLLALLSLFPTGALDLARAVKDDRTAAFARDAEALGEEGRELLARTRGFVVVSALTASADPKAAAELRAGFENLSVRAAGLDARLRDLRPQLPTTPPVQRQVDQLLAQLRAIKQLTDALAGWLRSLENG